VIRINLIPPEILQARKDEALWKWVWLGGGITALVLAMFWGFMFLQVTTTAADVASVQQEAANLQAQTSRFQIFQQKEADLNTRLSAVSAATQGRIDWARMLNELGLALPTDTYLTSLTGTDGGASTGTAGSTLTLAGKAIDEPDDTPDNGYKSVAKLLVRLTDLQQLDSVWLSSTTKEADTDTAAGMITWAVNARITSASAASTPTITGN
jgi:Tfp pilus assembly protein PilN